MTACREWKHEATSHRLCEKTLARGRDPVSQLTAPLKICRMYMQKFILTAWEQTRRLECPTV